MSVACSARTARRPLGAIGVLVLAVASFVALGLDAASPAPAGAATSGCRPVGGGPVDTSGGPHRATVVVDTGSGPVWSACISFSGAISGIEALDRAAAHIADLNPVYDQYSGLGRAVCRLRGVGTDPPDCLGKSVNYWSFSVNGRVASVGAGAVTVRDGDVQGWRHGTGGAPRAATAGTEATSAPPPTTTTTRPVATTAPAPPTTRPPAGAVPGPSSPPGGSLTGSGSGATPGGAPADGADVSGAADGSNDAVGADPSAHGDPSTGDAADPEASEADGAGAAGDGAVGDEGSADGAAAEDEELAASAGAAGAPGAGGAAGGGTSEGGSSMGSILGFVAALGLVGAGALVVRRRRLAITDPGVDPTTPAPA